MVKITLLVIFLATIALCMVPPSTVSKTAPLPLEKN